MISESKRKIAALALAGAMAIGGAAGVATTIASPAQNQSGIVMEAEAATVKPENIRSATAGNVIKNKAYNVYYDTGYSTFFLKLPIILTKHTVFTIFIVILTFKVVVAAQIG